MSEGKITVHTMHVPEGWSPEQTWEVISHNGKVPVTDGFWTNITVEGLTIEVVSEDEDGYDVNITGGRLIAWHPVDGSASGEDR